VPLVKRMGMGVSFLYHALQQGASACPDKSEHTRNADLTMVCHGGKCPDLLGPAGALLLGHGKEKTPPCPCVLPRAPIMPQGKAGISFQKANVLPTLLVFPLWPSCKGQ